MVSSPRSLPNVLFAAVFLCAASSSFAQTKPAKKPAAAPAKPEATPAAEKAAGAVLYVPGAYQNWKPADAPQIGAVPGSPTKFEGYVNFTGSGEQPFKFTDAPDWVHTNYGKGEGGTLSTDGQAGGLTVPSPGYYDLTVDTTRNLWTATRTTWSVIGNATPGGWEKDTPMTFDPDKQVWTVTLAMKADGSFKFRANNAWKTDFGLDGDGKLQYADNPFFTYNPNIKDLTVPDDGTYVLTLDLHVPGSYKFSIEAK